MHVDILMATYNGAAFMRTQILSLIGQTHSDWTLFVHDDGSTDDTVETVRRMAATESRIHLIEDGITRLGPGGNFMHLLQFSTAPLVCFCDQDDLWFENKLEQMVPLIEEFNSPRVVFTDSYVWHPDRNRIYGTTKSSLLNTMRKTLFVNGGMQGAGGIFNGAMRKFIDRKYGHIAMHDHILTLAGIVAGGIGYRPLALMLYRQHANNTTAHIPVSQRARIYSNMRNAHLPVVDKHYFEGVREFRRLFGESMSGEDRRLVDLYLSYPGMNPVRRFLSIMMNGFSKRNRPTLWVKLLLRKYVNQ